jgi:hypothetical protein
LEVGDRTGKGDFGEKEFNAFSELANVDKRPLNSNTIQSKGLD